MEIDDDEESGKPGLSLTIYSSTYPFTEHKAAPPVVPAQAQRPSARLMCTNLPQEVTDDMLAVLFQQCVLGPNCTLSGSPTVTPPGTKASKQHKLPGLLHPAPVVLGQKWRRFFMKHQNWRQSQKKRWTDSHSKKDGKCLLCTFEISRYGLPLLFRGTFAEMKHNRFLFYLFPQSLEDLFTKWSSRRRVLASNQAAIYNHLWLYISSSLLLLSHATRLTANGSVAFSYLPPRSLILSSSRKGMSYMVECLKCQ